MHGALRPPVGGTRPPRARDRIPESLLPNLAFSSPASSVHGSSAGGGLLGSWHASSHTPPTRQALTSSGAAAHRRLPRQRSLRVARAPGRQRGLRFPRLGADGARPRGLARPLVGSTCCCDMVFLRPSRRGSPEVRGGASSAALLRGPQTVLAVRRPRRGAQPRTPFFSPASRTATAGADVVNRSSGTPRLPAVSEPRRRGAPRSPGWRARTRGGFPRCGRCCLPERRAAGARCCPPAGRPRPLLRWASGSPLPPSARLAAVRHDAL